MAALTEVITLQLFSTVFAKKITKLGGSSNALVLKGNLLNSLV